MSKRASQGPQGDKDTNLFQFNMSSTPDDKPQRANAAQMARRQIRDIRRRPRAGTPTGSSSASFGGPFSSIDPNTVNSPSAGQQPMTNGFGGFGQSQSFPPASPAPNPPAQNGGSQFAFGSGGGSSSFNFSAGFGGSSSAPASNPFASINTGSASSQPAASNFSGFKGNMFNAPSGSQSPAQQSLPSGGLFGAGSQENGSAGGMFGNTTTSGPSSQSGTATANGNIFGQSTSAAPSTDVFGQPAADKPSSFAPSASFGSDSMQTSPDAKSSAQKPSAFGSGTSSFGGSTGFGGSGTGNIFGGTSSAPSQTPSKPLFGAKSTEQAAPATPSLFGAAPQSTPSTSAAPTSSAAPLTSGAATPSLFSATPKPAVATANPFQSTNLFGAPASPAPEKSTEDKSKEETKSSQPSPFQPSFNSTSASAGPSLFSQSASAASTQSTGASQPPPTGSLFAPKTVSTEGESSKPAGGNPFSSLFVPKPAGSESPKPEQKALPSASNMFASKPSSTEGEKTNDLSKAATSASPFTAPTLSQPSASAPQASPFSFSKPQPTPSAPAFGSPAASQSPLKVNGTKTATPAAPASSTSHPTAQTFENLQPSKMPSGLDKSTKEEVEMAHRVRLLNESFQREVAKLNTSTDSFDAVVQFYLRVRETIGAPVEGLGAKRKAPVDGPGAVDPHPSKKVRPFGGAEDFPSVQPPSNTTPSQLFGTPSASHKRKASEDNDDAASSQPAKRVGGDSTTANIFANSFSRSRTSDSDEPAAPSPKKLDAPSFKPSTPESAKPSLFSTTPSASPSKPAFTASTTPKETSTSSATPAQASPFKPTSAAPSSNTPPANPFVLKPTSDAGASASKPSLAIPKFGTGSGTTDFFAQFKANSDKEAEKEKKKRKAEDFDSDEDDEEEWERKDAEAQRKKREELQAQQNKRARFVPGQGFSFEEPTTTDEDKSDASASSSMLGSKANSFGKSSNIFGHLSATPSENGENENDDDADADADDTEEASASGDDAGRESSFAPTEDLETSKANGTRESYGVESSDEGDFAKALKKSKQADNTEEVSEEQGSGGRSLFDRVEYGQDGKPKRDDDKNVSSLLGSSKFASSFTSSASTPNPFAPSQSEKADGGATPKPAPTNIFGASASTTNIFGGSTSASPSASTTSVFATGATQPGSDNTWKLNTPIKFASDSSSSSAKPEAEPASGSGSPNPFQALFGQSSAGSKSDSDGGQKAPGFSFGGPSQAGSSLFTPSVLSGTPSRASTPGAASDAGGEGAEGDAAESLPQVDLSRGGAGEEDEEVVAEARSRGMKLIEGVWTSQGLGFLRILKNKKTSRGRVVLRADPSGNVILNAYLMKGISYVPNGTNIQFFVPQSEGRPEQWALRLKKPEAERISAAMEETKS